MAPNNTNRCSHLMLHVGKRGNKKIMDDFPAPCANVAIFCQIYCGLKSQIQPRFEVNSLGISSIIQFRRCLGREISGGAAIAARQLAFRLPAQRCEFTANAASFILLIPWNVCATPVEHADLVTASGISAAARSGSADALPSRAAHGNERQRVEPQANLLQAAIK